MFLYDFKSSNSFGNQLEIRDWSRRHPSEILILDFNHFYNLDVVGHVRFIREIISIFGVKSLIKRRPLAKLTLRNLWAAEENILVLYETDIPGDPSVRCRIDLAK